MDIILLLAVTCHVTHENVTISHCQRLKMADDSDSRRAANGRSKKLTMLFGLPRHSYRPR